MIQTLKIKFSQLKTLEEYRDFGAILLKLIPVLAPTRGDYILQEKYFDGPYQMITSGTRDYCLGYWERYGNDNNSDIVITVNDVVVVPEDRIGETI